MTSLHGLGAVTKVSDVPIPSGLEDINSNNKDFIKRGQRPWNRTGEECKVPVKIFFQLNCYNGKVVIVLNGGKSISTSNHVKIAESLFVSSSRKATCSSVPRKAQWILFWGWGQQETWIKWNTLVEYNFIQPLTSHFQLYSLFLALWNRLEKIPLVWLFVHVLAVKKEKGFVWIFLTSPLV